MQRNPGGGGASKGIDWGWALRHSLRGVAVPGSLNGRLANNAGDPRLTRREAEIAQLVSQGFPNKLVAHQLGIREGTVKGHLHNIYRKLRVSNRTGLIANRRR